MTALTYRPKLGRELEFIGPASALASRPVKILRLETWLPDTYRPDRPDRPVVIMGRNGRPRNRITLPESVRAPRSRGNFGCDSLPQKSRLAFAFMCRSGPQARRMPRKSTPWQERFWRYITPLDADSCWEWNGSRNEHGYGRLNRGRAGEGIIKAHRASYEIHYGPFPPELQVCHECDNPPCCNPAHLFLGTMKDNLRDAARKGRTGPQNGGSAACRKITDQQVREIRHAAVEGVSYQRLAREYGISGQQISEIALGRQRADAGGPIAAPRRVVGVRKSR